MRENAFVTVEHEGSLTLLTMNRPDKLNALSAEVLQDLEAAIGETSARAETRAVILTGAGKAFVAGADIAAMRELDTVAASAFSSLGHRIFTQLEELRVPGDRGRERVRARWRMRARARL